MGDNTAVQSRYSLASATRESIAISPRPMVVSFWIQLATALLRLCGTKWLAQGALQMEQTPKWQHTSPPTPNNSKAKKNKPSAILSSLLWGLSVLAFSDACSWKGDAALLGIMSIRYSNTSSIFWDVYVDPGKTSQMQAQGCTGTMSWSCTFQNQVCVSVIL